MLAQALNFFVGILQGFLFLPLMLKLSLRLLTFLVKRAGKLAASLSKTETWVYLFSVSFHSSFTNILDALGAQVLIYAKCCTPITRMGVYDIYLNNER